ncbi:MAG: formate transporter [Citromicrobium sp.]|nr:formate transporter [Citromicrobium sp.]MBT48227.1 formate transporter [Citromicrobium sp.]
MALPRSTPGSHHKGVMQMAEGNGSDDEKGPDQDKTERSDAAKESGHDIVREDLDDHEREIVSSHEIASAKLVHEIIRQRGIEELERPASALLWSAIAAGFVIGLSPYAIGALLNKVPEGPWMPLLMALGYSLGFIAVISGRLQLFTESTVTAVIPLATTPCWSNFNRTIRLWVIVLAGNMIGTFAFALFVHFNLSGQPEIAMHIREDSLKAITAYMDSPFLKGIPAGFMLATLVWAMPNLERQEVFIIAAITGLMYLAGVAHSIVGAAELWVIMLAGQIGVAQGLFGFLVPAVLGNVIGGGLLFGLLAHAQVVPEIDENYVYDKDRPRRKRRRVR